MEFVRKNKNKKKSNSSSLKVVYISSPMKVKTTASKFRSLVQALTGRDSDITKSMDIVESCNNFTDHFDILPQNNGGVGGGGAKLSKSEIPNDDHDHHHNHQFLDYFSYPLDQNNDSPTSSESLIDQQSFGGGETFVSPQMEDQYLQDVFTSSLFTDQFSLQGHLIGCFDAL